MTSPGDIPIETPEGTLPPPRSLKDHPMFRPVAAAALGAVIFLVLVAFGPFSGLLGLLFAGAVAAGAGSLVAFLPQLQKGAKGSRIDDSLPFFITHFGVLATTNLPRRELLRQLSENPEYAEVAGEMRRILRLTTEWGLGLSDAVRAVAESTPSKLFSAFLLRMAHALESGQPLEGFLINEQSVVMQEYASLYQANLLKVESWKEMYMNAMMTIGFLAVFASVLPLLGGGSTLILTAGVAATAVILEVLLGIVLKERLPRDRLSPQRRLLLPAERRLRLAFVGASAAGAVLGLMGLVFGRMEHALLLAAVPFVVPGFFAHRLELTVRKREADYPAFIRSVGAAAAARGGAIRDVLGSVLANKLGALGVPVRSLHRRLVWGVDDAGAWRRFGEETGSRLVDSFTTMFVQGIAAGGKPGPISQILSENMLRIQALRTSRRATAGAFRGLLFGLAAGLALVLLMGSGIFDHLVGTFGEHADILAEQGLLSIPTAGAGDAARDMLFVVVALHGVAAGIFFKLVEGGRLEGAALHASLQVWVGVLTGMGVVRGLPALL